MALSMAEMVNMWRELMGDRAASHDTTKIEKNIKWAWNYVLVDLIPGRFQETKFQFNLTAGTEEYDTDLHTALKGRVRNITGPAFIGDDDLKLFWRPTNFWVEYQLTDTNQSTPTGCLIYGTKLTFRPVPDATDQVTLYGSFYRADDLASGIENETVARACVRAAVIDFAGRLHYDDIVGRAAALFQASKEQLLGASLAAPRERKRRRDY